MNWSIKNGNYFVLMHYPLKRDISPGLTAAALHSTMQLFKLLVYEIAALHI